MKQYFLIFTAVILFVSCKKDDEKANVTLSLKGVNETLKSATTVTASDVKITDFRLSIRDVEFKKEDSDLDTNEIEFSGPFEIDLMNETGALSQTLGTIEVEEGTYKVVRFKLHKDKDRGETHVLYDRSIYIEGTIDEIPFEFWHDTSENLDIENEEGIEVVAGDINIVVQFTIDQFLNSLHTIDLSEAIDDDENGLIEINPDDDDENGDIADDLKANIKVAADLIKL